MSTAPEITPETPTTVKRTTGWVIMEALRGYGIDTVFGIPGTHNLEFYRPLAPLGIRPVTTRHEQGAGYGADGWSLRTGRPGVVLTTSGPGLLNALSAAGTAYCESRPMIILAPGPSRGAEFADIGTLHETKDQLGAASAIVEWGRRVRTAEAAVAAVHDAFTLFATGRPRPVYIEVPLDLLESETDLPVAACAPLDPAAVRETPDAIDRAAVGEAARLLAAAQRPHILAGGGARAAGSEIRALAERLTAPVLTSSNGKGVLDEQHPLALGSTLRLPAARRRAQEADVLLVVGAKLGEADLWVDGLDAHGTVIRIDVLATQLHKNQTADVGIVADARAALQAINSELDEHTTTVPARHTSLVARGVAETLAEVRKESLAIDEDSHLMAERIAGVLPRGAIVSTDSSQPAYLGLMNAFTVSEPNSVLYMSTYATLGYGLPAAIGARIASPERPTVVVTGDGALMFSVQECVTAVEQGIDLTIIVIDNGGYAEIRQNEADAGIAPIGVELVQPNWPKLVEAFGGTGRTAATVSELRQEIEASIAAGGLHLIHVKELADEE